MAINSPESTQEVCGHAGVMLVLPVPAVEFGVAGSADYFPTVYRSQLHSLHSSVSSEGKKCTYKTPTPREVSFCSCVRRIHFSFLAPSLVHPKLFCRKLLFSVKKEQQKMKAGF